MKTRPSQFSSEVKVKSLALNKTNTPDYLSSILISFITSLLLLFCYTGFGQIVNGYAEVTGISGTTLTLSSADESGDTFEDGEMVIVIQMQGDVLGNTSNTSSFGDMSSIGSVGLYEIATVSSHTESGALPNGVTLTSTLANAYVTGANSQVQVITFPTFGSPDYTTTGNMSAADWNGTTGGILAFNVDGTLTLAHSLSADGAGFRGGARDLSGSGSCDVTTFFSANTNAFAAKGEGIYKNTNVNYAEARGKILNGGGGGNEHNGGGGGGGGYTVGGDGGPGWNCGAGSAGGLGGLALGTFIDAGRIFLGGGGGGGEGNNSVSTAGADGGGIILVRANEIRTVGTCGISISADGNSSTQAGNDGGGGGGAGGCIVIQVATWNIAAGCLVAISSSAGNGGAVTSGAVHGGGGGGGQGAVVYSITQPTTNTTTSTNTGTGGCNNNSSPCNSLASPGGGISGTGIIENTTGPLPIELVVFNAQKVEDMVQLNWTTASETNNDYFQVERSNNGIDFKSVLEVMGAGNSSRKIDYYELDREPLKTTAYYRLKQIDFDGQYSYSSIVVIRPDAGQATAVLYPNPAKQGRIVRLENKLLAEQNVQLQVVSLTGEMMINKEVLVDEQGQLIVLNSTTKLPSGMYVVAVTSGTERFIEKLVVR